MYTTLIDGFRADPGLIALIRKGNFRDHAGENVVKLKDSLMPGDVPQLELIPTNGEFDLDATNTTSEGEQNFSLKLVAGNKRLQLNHFPLKYACIKALARLSKNLGLEFVQHVSLTDFVDDETDFEESKAQQGWVGTITITVRFVIQKQTLLA